MPCWEAFAARSAADRKTVLDRAVPTISIEAGVSLGWDRYADVCIGIDRFGASGPGGLVLDRLGMNVDNITAAAKELLTTKE